GYPMKNNKHILISGSLFLLSSIIFMIVTIFEFETNIIVKSLFGLASILDLISSIGFFRTYAKNNKKL
ncbi:MAG: hypothetical protein K2K06_07125, partial [Oscillospiraceae bacterium]|nr:hypothetical protein [Oscillospiraceae bacterium]